MLISGMKMRGWVLAFLDSVISITLISPLVVGYWRGFWQLMDLFLWPSYILGSVLTSLLIGINGHLLFLFSQNHIKRFFDRIQTKKILCWILSRLYTVVFAIFCVNHWRGVWQLWDLYTGVSWQSGAVSTALGVLLLVISRGVKNLVAPPFMIVPDCLQNYFEVPTLFTAQVCLKIYPVY